MTALLPELTTPAPLTPDHELDAFSCGVAPLDEWLKRRARQNEAGGGSRTFVLCAGRKVAGYYSLAAGSVSPDAATGQVRRNMPNPVPVVLLGRLAIDRPWQGKGLGSDLLRDAVLRVLSAGGTIGVRAILVHAISLEAKAFYEKHGFRPSPVDPMTLMIPLAAAEKIVAGTSGARQSSSPAGSGSTKTDASPAADTPPEEHASGGNLYTRACMIED